MTYESTKIIDLGSCAFRQWKANHSHCKFIHGYRLQAKFWFSCTTLDDKNWVVDFGGLKELKDALEKQFDHTLCVAGDDPLLDGFKSLHDAGGCDLRIMPDGVGIERTAEWCLKTADTIVRRITNNRCWVNKVEVWEHEKNSAIAIAAGSTEAIADIQPPVNVIRDTIREIENETGVPLSNVLKQIPASTVPQGNRPAPLNTPRSSGYSNLFGGTSWGA